MIETLAETTIAGPTWADRLRAGALTVLRPVAVVAVALLIGMAIIIYTGQNPLPAYENLLIEPFKSWDTFSAVLFFAIPLVLTGLAAAVSFRAGIFNIGGEGQLQMGALATAWIALSWGKLSPILLIPLLIAVGALGGALFAAIPGWLRAYWGATELVSTIMLNYVAVYIATYFVSPGGPLASSSGQATTNTIADAAQFQTFGQTQFHWGVVVALLAVGAVFVGLYRTPLGYEIRVVGANAPFAQYGGVAVRRVILGAMMLGGALAGIGGAVQVMGGFHAYSTGFFNPQWGFTGVTVALLARLQPIGVVVAAILYALLEEGAQLMENNTSVDHNIITVVQGLIILFVTVQTVVLWRRKRRVASTG